MAGLGAEGFVDSSRGPGLRWRGDCRRQSLSSGLHEETSKWSVICRNLADGKEVWRFDEERRIRPNHGITRSVPAVDGKYVFAFDPKCVLHALDAKTGKEIWSKSLVTDYKSKIPPWYNGQNPLLEEDRIIIATGGEAVLVALEKGTGKEIWRTPNAGNLLLAHASVMPATIAGVKQYLYGTLAGPLASSPRPMANCSGSTPENSTWLSPLLRWPLERTASFSPAL